MANVKNMPNKRDIDDDVMRYDWPHQSFIFSDFCTSSMLRFSISSSELIQRIFSWNWIKLYVGWPAEKKSENWIYLFSVFVVIERFYFFNIIRGKWRKFFFFSPLNYQQLIVKGEEMIADIDICLNLFFHGEPFSQSLTTWIITHTRKQFDYEFGKISSLIHDTMDRYIYASLIQRGKDWISFNLFFTLSSFRRAFLSSNQPGKL